MCVCVYVASLTVAKNMQVGIYNVLQRTNTLHFYYTHTLAIVMLKKEIVIICKKHQETVFPLCKKK